MDNDGFEDKFGQLRSELAKLLSERGVTTSDSLTAALDDEELDGAIATVRFFDDDRKEKSAGLLVYMIRSGEHTAYRRPEERGKPPSGQISPTLERAIKGSCLSPNGFTRDMARDMIKGQAKRLGMTQDALIDAVMGEEWLVTPPDARHDPEAPREERIADQQRYDREQAAR